LRGWGATLLVCLGLLSAAPQPARARAADEPVATRPGLAAAEQAQLFTADDLLLFEVTAEDRPLAEALPAYSALAGVYLPLGELARLLELAIVVDPNRARADGWVLREDRSFRLNLQAGEAEAGGRQQRLSPQDAALAQGEIYVRAELLEQLLPLRLKADVRTLVLEIEATEPLPFQARLAREARRQRLGAGRHRADEAQTFVPTPYVLFSPPAVDVVVSSQQGGEGFTSRYDLRLAGDLAYAGLQAFVAGEGGARPTEARVLLERKDPDRRAAVIPGLSRISLGDTYTPSLPLGARAAGGRGLAFTTEDFQEIGAFDEIDLRGELETGWEVELYIDEVLRGSQKDADTGQYEFEDVPLVVGLNVIRLVFYGPQGERRQEVRRLHVAGGGVRQRELLVKFGIVEEGAPVIDLRDGGLPPGDEDVLEAPRSEPPVLLGEPRGVRAVGQVAYGLTPGAAISAGFAHFHGPDGSATTQSVLGASASVAGFATQVNLAGDDAGGSAASVGLAGRIADVALVVRHAEFLGGFLDEGRSYASALKPPLRSTSLTLDSVLNFGRRSLPVGLRVNREQFTDGDIHLLATGRASTSVGRFLMSGAVRYERDSTARGETGRLAAAVTASGLIDERWRVRATAAWDRDVVGTLTLDRRWGAGHALRLGLVQRWGDHGATTVQVSHVWRLRNLDVSVFGGYAGADGEGRLGVQVATGLAFDGRGYRMVGPGVASGGAMSVHAFVDSDGDGRWRPGETAAAGLRVQGARRSVATDAAGRALITGLGDGARASVQFDTSAIEDPYLATPPSRLVFVPRPGRVAVAAFPLQQTGEVAISIALTREGEPPRPLSAVRLQLIDAAGRVAAEGRTEFDGALVVGGLRPGTYTMRIDPVQAATLGLVLETPAPISVPAAGGFVGQVAAQVRIGPPQAVATTPAAPLAAQDLAGHRAGAAPPERPASPLRSLRSLGRGFARLLAPLNPFRRTQAVALARGP
jgi:hypothetical protein